MLPPNVCRAHGFACWVLIALGVGHLSLTLVDAFVPTFFAPSDPGVLAEMRDAPVSLGAWLGAPGLTVWRGHLGWNLSVGLGFAFLGAVQLLLRRSDPLLLAATPIVPLAAVMSFAWAVLAATCWFWGPLLGFTLAAGGFAWTWRGLRGVQAPALPPADVRLLWIGALGMGLAGAFHGLATFPDFFTNALFSPLEPVVRRAMEGSDLRLPAMLGASTSTWRAYLGFNLSHGLGVAGYFLTAWLLSRDLSGVVARDRALRVLFAAFSTMWLVVALGFWFYAVDVITGFAAACHLALALGCGKRCGRRGFEAGERRVRQFAK